MVLLVRDLEDYRGKMKKIICMGLMLFLYQVVAALILYQSSYFNIMAYYLHPPWKGEVDVERLPMFYGDKIAFYFLKNKRNEASELVKTKNFSLAAMLVYYEDNHFFEEKEAKKRSFKFAELIIAAGYSPNDCEVTGKSSAKSIIDWGMMDKDVKEFLLRYMSEDELLKCNKEK